MLFKKDFQHYDQKQKELEAILTLVNFNYSEKLVDLGAGIGRLAIPLSEHLKVTAIDINKYLVDEIKNTCIEKVNINVKDYHPKELFDYGLIAWPRFKKLDEIFNNIKRNILKERGKLIVLKSSDHSLREITKELFPELFENGKVSYIDILQEYFTIEKERTIRTDWVFPDTQTAFDLLRFEIATFYGKVLNEQQKHTLLSYVEHNSKDGKVYLKASVRVILCN